jgi:hypothetical protein
MTATIQGTSSAYGTGAFPTAHTLSDDQKSQVQSILSQYDKNNLTAADAKAIFKAFRQAGIQPGADLKDAITAAGFNADQLRTLARPADGPRHGGHHPEGAASSTSQTGASSSLNSSSLQSLQQILSQYDLSNLSDTQESALVSQLNQAGLLQSGNLINVGA